MDYNQLKLRILELFKKSEEYESAQVLALIVSKSGPRHRAKAIEMALMRYWRQGLLKRERRGGRFYYSLSERGEARRAWLRSTMASFEA